MCTQKNYNEEKFDSFINKTIILSSRLFFKKQMNFINKENTIVDNKDFSRYLQSFIEVNTPFASFNEIDISMELNRALNCLSDIEQAVIFLLFNEELTQKEAADILEIYSKTVSKIKIRAIEKLKKHMEGDFENEK